jgi:hypothetical protein
MTSKEWTNILEADDLAVPVSTLLFRKVIADLESAEKRITALRGALKKYGAHLARCKKDYGVVCTCGFDAALGTPKEGEG